MAGCSIGKEKELNKDLGVGSEPAKWLEKGVSAGGIWASDREADSAQESSRKPSWKWAARPGHCRVQINVLYASHPSPPVWIQRVILS